MRIHHRSGYTLAEILIVLAIIASLVGICIPAIQTARQSVKSASCKNKLRNMSLAMVIYAQDQRGFYPIDTNGYGPHGGWDQIYWFNSPAFMDLYERQWQYNQAFNKQWKSMALADPADPNPAWFVDNIMQRYTEYVANRNVVNRCGESTYGYTSMRVNAIPRPSSVYLISDGGDPSYYTGVFGVSTNNGTSNGTSTVNQATVGTLQSLHRGNINIVFADQHIETRLKTSLPTTSSPGTAGNELWMKYP